MMPNAIDDNSARVQSFAAMNDHNLTEGERLAAEGIATAAEHAKTEYKAAVMVAIESVAKQNRVFCSDDIAAVLQHIDVQTHDRRVIGAMMRIAARKGWCKPYVCPHCQSVVTRKTKQKNSHASPMNYWVSLIHSPIA